MRVAPAKRRSTSQDTGDGFQVSIPAKRNVLAIVFLPLWLAGWTVGGVTAIRELAGQHGAPDLFLAFWLTGWSVGEAFAAFVWAWMLKGREIIILRADSLITRWELFGLGRSKEYDLPHATNVRVTSMVWNPYSWNAGLQFWGIGGGTIAFDYGAQTVRLAAGIDEPEAREIVAELKSRHPFTRPAS